MAEEYKISLGVCLSDNDFNAVNDKIKSLEKESIKIKLDNSEIDTQIRSIKQELESVGKTKGLDLNASALTESLVDIKGNVAEIKKLLSSLGSNVNTKSAVSSINDIGNALDNVSRKSNNLQEAISDGLTTSVNSNNAVNSAQQTGKKIGDTIEKSVKQSLNIDDVVEEQTANIMKIYSIVGEKGSSAFEKIKQAVIECRQELETIKNGNFDADETLFGNSQAIDKVTNAIAEQMQAVNNLGDEYVELAKYIADYNKKVTAKIQIPSNVKQEQGSDYTSVRATLGSAFTTGNGQDFADFIKELNSQLPGTIDLTKGEAAAFEELFRKVKLGREQIEALGKSQKTLQNTLSTDEILAQNGINRNQIYDSTMSAVDEINKAVREASQVSSETANNVVRDEQEKQQAIRKTADEYEQVSRSISLIRDSGDEVGFKESFAGSNQAAQEAQKHFQDLLAEEKAVVTVTEKFDNKNSLQSFIVNIQRATGEVEKLQYAMSEAEDDNRFLYQGGSVNDSSVERQLEQYTKKADALQTTLDKIKRGYSDLGANRPIKETGHINDLNAQYEKVKTAINDVRNADNATFSSMVSNAEREKTVLESMVKEFRNAETVATDLRSRDIGTLKITYDEKLTSLTSKMEKAGVYTSEFEDEVKQLHTSLSAVDTPKGLVDFLNKLDILKAKFESAKAEKDKFNASQNVASAVSGLESEIASLLKASTSIETFKTQIDGAEVSVDSLLADLKQVETQSDFKVVANRFDAFCKAADAVGIDLDEVNTKLKKLKDITKEIANLEVDIFKLDDADNIAKGNAKLEELKSQAGKLRAELERDFPSVSFDEIDKIVKKGEEAISDLIAKKREADNALAKKVELGISEDKFSTQVRQIETDISNLANVSSEVKEKFEALKTAESNLNTAFKTGILEDKINAWKQYEQALIEVENQYKKNKSAESDSKSMDFGSKLKIVQNDLAKFKAAAKDLPQMASTISELDTAIAKIGDGDFNSLNKFANQLKVAQSELTKVKAETFNTSSTFEKLMSILDKADKLKINIGKLDVNENKKEIAELTTQLNNCEKEFDELYRASKKDVLNVNQINELNKRIEEGGDNLKTFKARLDDLAKAQDFTEKFDRLKTITKEIANLKIDIYKMDDLDNINYATNQLEELSKKASELRAELSKDFPYESLDEIDNIAKKGEEAISDLIAKKREADNALAKKVEIELVEGKFSTQVRTMEKNVDNLSHASSELKQKLDILKTAESNLNTAFKTGTLEDKINAWKQYERTLADVENQYKKNKIAEDAINNSVKLEQQKQGLSLDMSNWLKDNSAAAKKFGSQIAILQKQLKNCDNVEYGNIKREFQNLKKEAKSLGLATQSFGDQLKKKFAEFTSYFSIAQLFNYAERAVTSTYQIVKELDTAMTGLYRVTDLTAAEYNNLFDNMIDSAKEYGATLTDIIDATTDWVRAGFDADTSLGLAEITTMYQHISDLDYDTASENLITAYNGFKKSLNSVYGDDQIAAVEYIADIYNELDNKFAVTSAGLGEAISRSASALELAGNTIQETAG